MGDYAPTGTMDGGELILTVPSGWTAPQVTTAGTAGYTTAASTDKILRGSVGTLTVIDQVVTIPITSLASGQSIRVRYGSGSGSSGAVEKNKRKRKKKKKKKKEKKKKKKKKKK